MVNCSCVYRIAYSYLLLIMEAFMSAWILKRFPPLDDFNSSRVKNLFIISIVTFIAMVVQVFTGENHNGINTYLYMVCSCIIAVAFLVLVFGRSVNISLWIYALAANLLLFVNGITNRVGYIQGDSMNTLAFYGLMISILSFLAPGVKILLFTGFTGISAILIILFSPYPPIWNSRTVSDLNTMLPVTLDILMMLVIMSYTGTAAILQSQSKMKALSDAKSELTDLNRSLENTVIERTASLKSILDNSGQGFLTIGLDFTVIPGYSIECFNIFGREIAGLPIGNLLFGSDSSKISDLHNGLNLIFNNKLAAKAILRHQEKLVIIGDKYVSIDYKYVSNTRILCILTDITSLQAAKALSDSDNKKHSMIYKALNNKHSFSDYVKEAKSVFTMLKNYIKSGYSTSDIELLLRSIHTFKGNAGYFGFNATFDLAHSFEMALEDNSVLGSPIDLSSLGLSLHSSFINELKIITNLLGDDWINEISSIIIPRIEFNAIRKYVFSNYPNDNYLASIFNNLTKIELQSLMSRLPDAVISISNKLGKKMLPLSMEIPSIRVNKRDYSELANSFIHIINNMVDHGIESPPSRVDIGKPPEGSIAIKVVHELNNLKFIFSDDGAGIDIVKLKSVAINNGIVTDISSMSDNDILNLIWIHGLSSKSNVTTTSGRGVGLAAVKSIVDKLGGSVGVASKSGIGTQIYITIPLSIATNSIIPKYALEA